MATRTLQIVLAGDPSSASRSFRKVEQDADRMGKKLDREGSRVRGFATITGKGFSRVGIAAGGMATAGGAAAALLAKSFVSGATSINESLSKNVVLFGKHADSVDRFSQRTAKNLGISRQAALEATGTFGNLFVALDIGPKKSAGMSVALTKLAADLASFNNASPEDALEAIRSGLVGETEPLRKFGVNLNDAALRTQALKMGLIDTVKNALTPQQKALAVNALLFKQTEKAQGDFARTSGGLANQQRILKARLADSGAELGAKLMPAALAAVKAINSLFDSSSSGGRAISAMGKVAAQAADWLKDAWATAVVAVNRFVKRNQEDIQQVIQAVRNYGRFVRNVIEDVVIPMFRRILPVVRGMVEGIVTVLRGVIRVLSGIINGDWALVWKGLKDIPAGMIKAIKASLKGLWEALRDGVKALVPLALRAAGRVGKAIVDGIVSGIKAAPGRIADAITGLLPGGGGPSTGLNPAARRVGDGIGRGMVGKFSGGLHGAQTGMGPIASIGARFGLPISSGRDDHSKYTASGNLSYHGSGEALDFSNGVRTPQEMAFAQFMVKNFGGRLAELIYTPLGFSIKDGRRVSPIAASDHYDHVHVAYDLGRPGVGDGIGQAVGAARAAGFRGQNLINAVAIAGAESKYDAQATNFTGSDHSVGFWQINQLAHKGRFGTDAQLKNPSRNARAAFTLFRESGWGPWTTWPSAARGYLARARAAVAAGGSTGGGNANVGGGGSGSVVGHGNTAQGVGDTHAGGGGGAMDLQLARVGVGKARAETRDDLSGMIKALRAERAIKRKRLRLITRVLKGRLKPARRVRLLQEQATLIGEIGTLSDTIREYVADQGGGATTISRADELDAGVDTSVDTSGGAADSGGGSTDTGSSDIQASIDALTTAINASVAFGERVQSTENFQLKKYLADVIGGQVVGYGVVGRSFTPGTGVAHSY